MAKGQITFCYRKIVDTHSTSLWDRLVFNDTYAEFLMQAQYFNKEKKYSSFAQLLQQVPGAEKLHFLVSSSCIGYLQQLQEKIPDIYNILGKQCLTFKSFHFEIINSDIYTKSSHQIAINFYTEPLIWHETIGDYLLISDPAGGNPQLTDLIQLIPYLSIHSIKPI